MKNAIFFTIVFLFLGIQTSFTQNSPDNFSSYDIKLGVHSGIYDCNQSFEFPRTIGGNLKLHYNPDVMDNLFIGLEGGILQAQGEEGDWSRENGIFLGYLSLYPGLSISLSRSKMSLRDRFNARMVSKKLKLGAGLSYGFPFGMDGWRPEKDVPNTEASFGYMAMTSLDVSSRMSFFATYYRLSSDTDGKGFNANGVRSPGNLHDRTFFLNLGLSYNLVGS